MKERKYLKLRTDMYEDTKFKIIDKRPERDTIHIKINHKKQIRSDWKDNK